MFEVVETFQLIEKLSISVSALSAAYVAISGLNNWKKRKLWEENRELAKRVLLETSFIQNAIDRIKAIQVGDMRLDDKLSEQLTEKYTTSESIGPIPYTRGKIRAPGNISHFAILDNVIETLEITESSFYKMRSIMVECDAFWGGVVRKHLDEIRDILQEFRDIISKEVTIIVGGEEDSFRVKSKSSCAISEDEMQVYCELFLKRIETEFSHLDTYLKGHIKS